MGYCCIFMCHRFVAGLELWITHRLFVLEAWGRSQGIACRGQLTAMATVLGYELDPHFWTALD